MERRHLKLSLNIILVILCLSTAFMIYLSNMEAVAFDAGLYSDKFSEYGIYSRFNSSVDIDGEAEFLIGYLQEGSGADGSGEIDSDLYNAKEKTHLVEVKDLFAVFHTLLNIAVALSVLAMFLLLVFVKKYLVQMKPEYHQEYLKQTLSRILILTGYIVDGIAALFGLMVAFFSGAFYYFHILFFRTDTWMLDPRVDNLIRMFPEQFFFDLFLRIVLMSVLFGTVMIAIGFLIRLGKPGHAKKEDKK